MENKNDQGAIRSREIYAALIANFPVFVAGMSAGFPALILPQLQSDMDLSEDQLSWFAFAGYFSILFGLISLTFTITKFGRKTHIKSILYLFLLGWIIILLSSSFPALVTGAVMCGSAAGASLPVATTYIAETSRAEKRGSLLSMIWLLGIIGTSTVYVLEFSLPWRGAVLLIICICLTGLFKLRNIPETKFWYILRKRKEDALRSAAWFENSSVALKEVDILYALINFGNNLVDKNDLHLVATLTCRAFRGLTVKPFLLGVAVSVFRCGTGKILFTVYPMDMFGKLGTPYSIDSLCFWYAVLNFLSCVLNLVLFNVADKYRRKSTFLLFNGIMITALLVLVLLHSVSDAEPRPLSWLRVICLFVYLICESTGYFCTSSVLIVEIMPMTQRAIGLVLNFLIMNIVFAVYVKVFPLLEPDLTFRALCVYFLANMLVVLALVKYFYPETCGKPFVGCEKMLINAIKNGDVERAMSTDWLRDPHLQRFLTEDEFLNIDLLNNEAIQHISKEWAQHLKDVMRGEKVAIAASPSSSSSLSAESEPLLRVVNETESRRPMFSSFNVAAVPPPLPSVELFDAMKTSFNAFMETSPFANPWQSHKNLVYQQQDWIRNTLFHYAGPNSGHHSKK